MANWYVGSVQHAAVGQWAAATAYSVGNFVRQLAAPTAGNERVWRCTTAGTSDASEPAWSLTKGSTTNDNDVVWTEVTGNETYEWDAPLARIHTAITWGGSGAALLVANNHVEAVGSTPGATYTLAGNAQVVCVNPSTGAEATGADWGATGVSIAYLWGIGAWSGFTFRRTDSTFLDLRIAAYATANQALTFRNSTLRGAGVNFLIRCGNEYGYLNKIRLENCIVDALSNTTNLFMLYSGIVEWIGGSVGSTGTIARLFQASNHQRKNWVYVQDVDLTAVGSGNSLVDLTNESPSKFTFVNCRTTSGVNFLSGTPSEGGVEAEFIRCGAGASNFDYFAPKWNGSIFSEDTNVNGDSAVAIGRRLVSNASASHFKPLIMEHLARYNAETTDPITVTIPVLTDGVTLTDADIWPVVSYLGNASYPLGSLATERQDYFTAGVNWATDTADWVTTGLTSPVKQKLSITFSPKMAGPILIGVHLARPSTTVYLDRGVLVS